MKIILSALVIAVFLALNTNAAEVHETVHGRDFYITVKTLATLDSEVDTDVTYAQNNIHGEENNVEAFIKSGYEYEIGERVALLGEYEHTMIKGPQGNSIYAGFVYSF